MRNSLFLFVCLLALSGCTNKMQDVNSTIAAYYDSFHDIQLPEQELRDLPYSSAYLRLDDNKQIFIVLAFADINPETGTNRLTWIASDKAMITTENGRIVKTAFLEGDDLTWFEGLEGEAAPVYSAKQWQAIYDWSPNYRSGFIANIATTQLEDDIIESPLWRFSAKHYLETVTIGDQEFTNQYWIDSNQKVVKTIQYLGPDMRRIEMTILKTYQK
ncbi:YjbF family lipoprotein [Vibrio sp. SCSIO 43136]|uniref:YjbF family lipoprotein n=1 Tax=Vibrio sp. SCSIO 43136 TaxID=2819101 RepID=UPI002075F1A7|nr:YjbF family lipoprotein [Vibrio sp. SCSIO 43136]USD65132.1 YjbF family lipoprotein [Vibrio sp. SCSIO 43136]